ncbi:hypothetical protein [Flagellimonas onchidii]|uniref:hypothetical protein n=1 Tax=Flagellimonas onchidii TaxID=2562684 RepID=UPI0010A5BBF2|nr:hypothetical protein [Allomuricauda onchidii]
METRNTFHLGITMAGAVSAGAYTAGFMDYLIEVLELWEEQKTIVRNKIVAKQPLNDFEKKIPLHNVCIDALGGASAGGMVGVITALSAFSKMEPVKEPSDTKTGNILYDSWVLLDDDTKKEGPKMGTFEKMLLTDDFENNKDGIPSLLNTQPIDRIADKVFDNLVPKDQKRELPSYISEDLRVLVTLCSLRGVPFELNFENFTSANFPYSPGHRMNEHMIVAHFKLKYNVGKDKDIFLKFDPYDLESKELIKLCTKATGAFPIGLAPRHFERKLSKEYIKNSILRNLGIKNERAGAIEIEIKEEYFDFTNVDGGTINNEPYSEVVQVLEELNPPYNSKLPMFGTVMIDPFPNFYNQDEFIPIEDSFSIQRFQKSFWDVIPKLYTTLREQVRVKHSGSFYRDYLRLLVFPIKWEKMGVLKNHPPLSCAALGGFGGFLDIEFRKHDFFLGRNNARNFLRAFLMLEYDANNMHPLFKELNKESLRAFKRENKEKVYFPIIPDINLLFDKENQDTNPFKYTIGEFPRLQRNYLESIKSQMKNRIVKIITYEINNKFKKNWMLRNTLKLIKKYIANKITQKIIVLMEKDFEKRKMLS